MGPKIRKKMRQPKIWPHNSKRKTFDPFLAKNCRKLAKSTIQLILDSFLPKGGQMSFDLNSEGKFGITFDPIRQKSGRKLANSGI